MKGWRSEGKKEWGTGRKGLGEERAREGEKGKEETEEKRNIPARIEGSGIF